jgi:hypothetical protein
LLINNIYELDCTHFARALSKDAADSAKIEVEGLKAQITDMQQRIDNMIQNLLVNTTVVREKDGKIYETVLARAAK